MKKTIIIALSLLVLIGAFLIFSLKRPSTPKPTNNNQINQQTGALLKWPSITDSQSSVVVIVTPVDISADSKELKFDVSMNTHSVELNQDMTKIAVIVDDKGKEYTPLNWNGPVGGHHRDGQLTFNQVASTSKSLDLKISGIGGVVRSFVWQR